MNAELQSLCYQLSLSISIFYYFHNVIVYLVFVKSIQNDLFEENSAVTNNHTRRKFLHNSCRTYFKVYDFSLMASKITKYPLLYSHGLFISERFCSSMSRNEFWVQTGTILNASIYTAKLLSIPYLG